MRNGALTQAIVPSDGNELALCNECARTVAYSITFEHGCVYLDKTCPEHGEHKALLSADVEYYRHAHTLAELNSAALPNGTLVVPYMIIVEAVDQCDMECPTCIAASTANAGNFRDAQRLVDRVARFVKKAGQIELLMVSGGEPTLHPHILEILQGLCASADRVMLITNGVKLAADRGFVAALANLNSRFEVYLQFDSQRGHVLKHLRGVDCCDIRRKALENLALCGIPATLVCVIKKGFNDDEVAAIVRYASSLPNVRGVTFQPIRSSGRHKSFDYTSHWIALTEIRTRLLADLGLPTHALVPHPRDPENACIGYFTRDMKVRTDVVIPRPNADIQARYPLYSVPETSELGGDLFRIAIISFLDRFNFTTVQSRRSGIAFLHDDDSLINLEKRFLPTQPNAVQAVTVQGARTKEIAQ